MKKFILLQTLIFSLFITGCEPIDDPVIVDDNEELIPILPDDSITMENLDEYLGRTDVQYVDLRNFDAKFRSGYIKGFDNIPFFDYLDSRAFLRDDGFNFDPDQIRDEYLLRMLFDEEKAILLYADGCIRSDYLKDVLFELGYTRVYTLGGYFEYEGEHKTLGDGDYAIGNTEYKYYELEDGTTYHVSLTYDMGKMILDIRFDITDSFGVSYRNGETSPIDYNEQLTILENFIVNDLITGYGLQEALADYENNKYNNIENYTLGYSEEFLFLISKIGSK